MSNHMQNAFALSKVFHTQTQSGMFKSIRESSTSENHIYVAIWCVFGRFMGFLCKCVKCVARRRVGQMMCRYRCWLSYYIRNKLNGCTSRPGKRWNIKGAHYTWMLSLTHTYLTDTQTHFQTQTHTHSAHIYPEVDKRIPCATIVGPFVSSSQASALEMHQIDDTI